jgi:hypothetical protein
MTTTAVPVARTLPDFCALAQLGDDAKALLHATDGPRQYLRRLLEAEQFADAVRFVAHALPTREGIWWAWVCARRASGAEPPPAIRAALDATERWVTQPTDENRRLAMRMAEEAGLDTPAGCAALAVFFSGGSIAPPESPPVPAPEFVSAKAIAGAVIAAAVTTEPEKAPEKFRAFIAQGMEVVNKLQLWGPA